MQSTYGENGYKQNFFEGSGTLGTVTLVPPSPSFLTSTMSLQNTGYQIESGSY